MTSELVEKTNYLPFGARENDYRQIDGAGASNRWSSFREDYGFTGKEEDVEVGLTYFGKRFLLAQLGRWVTADPLAVHAAGRADLNLYAYVKGAILKNVDPLGLEDMKTEGPVGRSTADETKLKDVQDSYAAAKGRYESAVGEANSLMEKLDNAYAANIGKGDAGKLNAINDAKHSVRMELDAMKTAWSGIEKQYAALQLTLMPVLGPRGTVGPNARVLQQEAAAALKAGLDAVPQMGALAAIAAVHLVAAGNKSSVHERSNIVQDYAKWNQIVENAGPVAVGLAQRTRKMPEVKARSFPTAPSVENSGYWSNRFDYGAESPPEVGGIRNTSNVRAPDDPTGGSNTVREIVNAMYGLNAMTPSAPRPPGQIPPPPASF